MIAFAWYLLKVIICSGVLTGYYYLALRNKVFHQWNRFYLLLAVPLSILLPLCSFDLLYTAGKDNADAIRLLQAVATTDDYVVALYAGSQNFDWQILTLYLYALVSFILFAALIFTFLRLRSIIKIHSVQELDGIKFLNTQEKGTPFSFFNYLFWNSAININTPSGQQIFRHELAHVRERHTLDKLFMQIVLIGFWCNPFFWIIRSELRIIHEFIADKKSVDQQDASALAAMMLQTIYPIHYSNLINPFFHQSVKRRLLMLTKLQNSRVDYLSRIAILPLIAIVTVAFTIKPKENIAVLSLEKKFTVVIDAGHGLRTNGQYDGAVAPNGIYEDEINLLIAKMIKAENNNPNIDIILTREGNNTMALKDRLAVTTEAKADVFISIHVDASPKQSANGFSIIVPSPKSFSSILLGSSINQSLSRHVKTLDTLRYRNAGVWILNQLPAPASILIECGYLSNKDDLAYITKEQNQKLVARSILKGLQDYFAAVEKSTGGDFYEPLTKQDTLPKKRILTEDIVEMNVLSDKRIELKFKDGTTNIFTLAQLKKEGLINDAYGTKQQIEAKGKAESSYMSNTGNVNVHGVDSTKKPLLVINGEVYLYDALNEVNPNSIESVNVLKDASALAKWGNRALNGAIEIKLKPGVTGPEKKESYRKMPFKEVEFGGDTLEVYKGDLTIKGGDIRLQSPNTSLAYSEPTFTRTEVPPLFPGGLGAWRKFLEKNLNVSIAEKNKAPKGSYTVTSQFIVEKDGSLSNIEAITSHGYGMEEEVIRVMQNGPKWISAIQNGKNVRAYHKQSITFVITE